ncbi:MAG: hypothetical protein R3231_12400 [bacterium]|nr:hypothetical protein [bacterium]
MSRNVPTLAVTGPAGTHWALFALTNLSIELARQGHRVLVVDDEPGELNVAELMGLVDVESQGDRVFAGGAMGVKIAYRTAVLNDLLSRSSGTHEERQPFWPEAYCQFDFILYHLPPGRAQDTATLLEGTTLCIAMTGDDPEGMVKAYGGLKNLHLRQRHIALGLTVITDEEERAALAFTKMAGNVKRFLARSLASYAWLKTEPGIKASIGERVPLVLKSPLSPVRMNLMNLTTLIVEDHRSKGGELDKNTGRRR